MEEILRYFHEQHGKEVGTTFDLARRKLSVLKREECRLVDAYQGQVIELEELRERRSAIDQRRKEQVAQEDMGKIIGKQGRNAQAIRIILGAAGMKLKKRFILEIIEKG